ncbi:MAG TPA: DNA repair protein RecN [Bacillota bacterium]|nr:DNA repair protein RecN [Bacillota bacterium]
MLISLHIENIAVIRSLSIELRDCFTVLTGETGAGKSILIDSISLLCGARSDRELIRTGEESALVEGCFAPDERMRSMLEELDAPADEDGLLFVSRRISADGRSVSKLNGRQIPTQKLREIMSYLVNIHGQQDTQAFRDRSVMLSFLDSYSGCDDELSAYTRTYSERAALMKKLDGLRLNEDEKRYRTDYLKYRINEIKQISPKPGEQETLAEKRDKLRHAELIGASCAQAYALLYESEDGRSANDLIDDAAKQLEAAGRYVPELAQLAKRLESARREIEDAAICARDNLPGDDELGTAVLDRVEERLMKLAELCRKYGSIEGALEAQKLMSDELDTIENNDEHIKKLEKALRDCDEHLAQNARTLSIKRREGAERLSKAVCGELAELDMKKTVFEVRVEDAQLSPTGSDSVEFLVSANAGESLRPLAKVASGGELSRIMLALRTVSAGSTGIPVLIFDEIDTGISGATSVKLGRKLRKLAETGGTQVLCITHSPQVAATAQEHFLITKNTVGERTQTSVELLSTERRIDEIARIIGGTTPGEAAKRAAGELLDAEN